MPDVFAYQGSKTDGGVVAARILSDGQDEPVTRIQSAARETFDLSFQWRQKDEFDAAKAYHIAHFPDDKFIYRDFQQIPPVDFNMRITSEFQKQGQQANLFSYGFSVIESKIEAAAAIPAVPEIPDEINEIPDIIAPSVPASFLVDGFVNPITATTVSFTWEASTDNNLVVEYQIQYATNSGFTTGVGSQTFAYPLTQGTVTGLPSNTHLWFRIRAKDTSGNYSAWTTGEVDAATLSTDSEAPSVPEGLMILGATASSFFGQFDSSTDNISVTGYELQHALDVPMTVEPTIVDIGNTIVGGFVQFNITGVESDTEYYYRIRAYDAAGNFSDWSGIEFAHTDLDAFDPATLAGLVYYTEGDLLTGLTDSNPISSVTDFSGNGNHATASGSARPLYRTGSNGLNSLPVIKFDGVDDGVLKSGLSDSMIVQTVALVYKDWSMPDVDAIEPFAGLSGNELIRKNNLGNYEIGRGGSGWTTGFALPVNKGAIVVKYDYAAGMVKAWVNNSLVFNGALGGSLPSSELLNQVYFGNAYGAFFGEVSIAAAFMTADEADESWIEDFFSTYKEKYDLY